MSSNDLPLGSETNSNDPPWISYELKQSSLLRSQTNSNSSLRDAKCWNRVLNHPLQIVESSKPASTITFRMPKTLESTLRSSILTLYSLIYGQKNFSHQLKRIPDWQIIVHREEYHRGTVHVNNSFSFILFFAFIDLKWNHIWLKKKKKKKKKKNKRRRWCSGEMVMIKVTKDQKNLKALIQC